MQGNNTTDYEKKQAMLTDIIRRYGFEHVKTITFAGYVEHMDLGNCEFVYKQFMN